MEYKIKTLKDLATESSVEYDMRDFKRGEIYYVDLEDIGSITRNISNKSRPAIVIQNNMGNAHSPTLIVALITSATKKEYPFQYYFQLNGRNSVVMFNQIMTLDKNRVLDKIGELTPFQMLEADKKILFSLQLDKFSLDNIIDFNVISSIIKKTASENLAYFEFEFLLTYNRKVIIKVSLSNLKLYKDTITSDMPFDEIKQTFDCCKGLHWLISHSEE